VRLILFTVLFFALPAFAEESQVLPRKYELQLSPNLGWSNFSGFHLGLDSTLALPLSARWQWKFGGGFTARLGNSYTTYSLTTGAVYNFKDDWSEGFFVGAGVGYGNQIASFRYNSGDDDRSLYGYAEFGKRFKLNRSGTLMWTPNLTVASDFKSGGVVMINPMNFSWTF